MFSAAQIVQLIKTDNLKQFYNDRYWRKLSHAIIAENHNECYLCKQQGKYKRAILVHHVRHLREHPELAYSCFFFDEDGKHIQLMPLCYNCHERIHERGIYVINHGFINDERW